VELGIRSGGELFEEEKKLNHKLHGFVEQVTKE
jgi:hypothetical protein